MGDELKISINIMQDLMERDSENILLIFDNPEQLERYKKNTNFDHSNEILITINDLLCKGLIGIRFRRYWFMTDRDIYQSKENKL